MSAESEAEVRRRTRELGGVVSAERAQATAGLYAPLHTTEPFDGIEITRDQSYGPHDRNRLDLFRAQTDVDAMRGRALPVVAFVHGGNFVAGDKRIGNGPFYDNVGVWAARDGYLGVTLTYRLAPEHQHPSGSDDVARALAWLQSNCERWGGNPSQIVLVGASAGATHVATALGSVRARDGVLPAGIALLSGMYDLGEFGDADVLGPYYGDDEALWRRASPLATVAELDIPVLVAISEHDPEAQHRQMNRLLTAIVERHDRMPHLVFLRGHNHFSEVLHIGTSDRLFSDQLSSFIAACCDTT